MVASEHLSILIAYYVRNGTATHKTQLPHTPRDANDTCEWR